MGRVRGRVRARVRGRGRGKGWGRGGGVLVGAGEGLTWKRKSSESSGASAPKASAGSSLALQQAPTRAHERSSRSALAEYLGECSEMPTNLTPPPWLGFGLGLGLALTLTLTLSLTLTLNLTLILTLTLALT